MSRRTTRSNRESGAVAIVVAIMASLLMMVAAMSVDLGNAWARKRVVQKQVDVAAISAANWARDTGRLPADTSAKRTAIAEKVAAYMLKSDNVVPGQPATSNAQLTSTLTNASAADGEIVYAIDGSSFRVVAPPATVQFGLASLFFNNPEITAAATVGVFSELPATDVVPFWLPQGCAYGPVDADTTNGGGNGGGGAGGGATDTNGSTAGSGVSSGSPQSFQSTDEDNSHDQWTTETFSFRVVHQGVLAKKGSGKPIGDPTVRFEFRNDPTIKWDIPGTWTNTPKGQQVWNFEITIEPDDVTMKSVQWYYQTEIDGLLSNVNNLNIQTKPEPVVTPSGCSGSSRGNFGQLDSPRADGYNGNNVRIAANLAFGLDHTLEPLGNAAGDECTNPGRPASTSPVRKAEQLDSVSRDGNNCIVADPGNDGPQTYDGLISGVGSQPGRLDAGEGPTKAGCNGGNAVVRGTSINNDLLSCYLIDPSDPLSRISANTGVTTGILDPSVTKSPRFVWLPVVYKSDRSSKSYQPILKFVPGFITDEAPSSTRTSPAYADTTRDNGVQINGNSVKALAVYTFNPDALAVQEANPYTTYDPSLARPIVRLTE